MYVLALYRVQSTYIQYTSRCPTTLHRDAHLSWPGGSCIMIVVCHITSSDTRSDRWIAFFFLFFFFFFFFFPLFFFSGYSSRGRMREGRGGGRRGGESEIPTYIYVYMHTYNTSTYIGCGGYWWFFFYFYFHFFIFHFCRRCLSTMYSSILHFSIQIQDM